ncbi:MAG: Conserved domain protein [uncultured Sulfurovum sp.]|uniref:Conserved domain protein n=1 Tax=uncultured Sulfurovum sp. TaxID=269237 RepID=A0A6S6S3C6_9BACT|nr:MAG: Conserved domain protein [uncultured Sulfurovum sp.]
MGIREELAAKWDTDYFNQKLESISFNEVGLRGVKNSTIKFDYPITAIAGTNGIGKTTILQLIACLYHNTDAQHKPYRFSNAKNAKSYYTFSDFFIHFKGEEKSENTAITYKFFQKPEGKKAKGKVKTHTLKKGKKWNDYRLRPNRYTDFYGVSRVLPANEFNTFKNTFSSSTASFSQVSLSPESTEMIKNILGKPLASVDVNSSPKIQNFQLNRINLDNGLCYSNFNMGAGEEVIISLISRISSLPNASIVLIEELELGLHPKAQKLLMEKLFQIVYAKRLQLIFTTHSPFLFDAMPKEGRILLRKPSDELEVMYKPSSELAFTELTGECVKELTVYVEDKVAKSILETLLSSSVRKRIDIADVGSKENVVRMVGAHYRNVSLGKAIAVADGDLTDKELTNWYKKYVLKEGESFDEVFPINAPKMFSKFPGDNAPEKFILAKLKSSDEFVRSVDDSDEFCSFIVNEISLGDHHNLFRVIASEIGLSEELAKMRVIDGLVRFFGGEFEGIIRFVREGLE